MAKYIITVISDFWASKFAQYTIQKIAPLEPIKMEMAMILNISQCFSDQKNYFEWISD